MPAEKLINNKVLLITRSCKSDGPTQCRHHSKGQRTHSLLSAAVYSSATDCSRVPVQVWRCLQPASETRQVNCHNVHAVLWFVRQACLDRLSRGSTILQPPQSLFSRDDQNLFSPRHCCLAQAHHPQNGKVASCTTHGRHSSFWV